MAGALVNAGSTMCGDGACRDIIGGRGIFGGISVRKRELEQYRSIAAELNEIQDRINRNIVHDVVIGSEREFPYAARSFSVGGAVEYENGYRDMFLRQKLEAQKQAIEDFVESIPDSVTRRIFRYRYIDGRVKPSWQWIAVKIGGGNTSDSTRMIHNRYLKKL